VDGAVLAAYLKLGLHLYEGSHPLVFLLYEWDHPVAQVQQIVQQLSAQVAPSQFWLHEGAHRRVLAYDARHCQGLGEVAVVSEDGEQPASLETRQSLLKAVIGYEGHCRV
jgi:hypothetical protein